MSNRSKIALALLAGAVLLFFALRGVDLDHVRAIMGQASPLVLVIALAVYLSAYFIRSLRWRLILRPIQSISVPESFFMLMAGYFLNYIVPIRAGEVAKSFFLKKLKGLPIAVSLPTVFLDKLLELFSVLLVIVLVPVLSVRLSGSLSSLIVAVATVFLIAVGLLTLAVRNGAGTARILMRLLSWLPERFHDRMSSWISLFVDGLSVARTNARNVWSLLALTGLAVALDAVYFYLMFRAFSIDVAFPTVLFGYTLISLSYVFPTPPAQIGYNEAIMGLIFAGGMGMGRAEVTAVMLGAHLLTGLLVTGVGLASFAAMSIRVTESFRRIGNNPQGR